MTDATTMTSRSARRSIRYHWADPLPPLTRRDVTKSAGIASVVVLSTVGPGALALNLSFYSSLDDILGIWLSVALTLLTVMLLMLMPSVRQLIRQPFIRSTIISLIVFRIALYVSWVTCLGAIPDYLVVLTTFGVARDIGLFELNRSLATFAWFLSCTVVWTLIITVLGSVIYGLQRLFRKMPTGRPGEICLRCGYDVHMSTGQCPECVEPIPPCQPKTTNDRLAPQPIHAD